VLSLVEIHPLVVGMVHDRRTPRLPNNQLDSSERDERFDDCLPRSGRKANVRSVAPQLLGVQP